MEFQIELVQTLMLLLILSSGFNFGINLYN